MGYIPAVYNFTVLGLDTQTLDKFSFPGFVDPGSQIQHVADVTSGIGQALCHCDEIPGTGEEGIILAQTLQRFQSNGLCWFWAHGETGHSAGCQCHTSLNRSHWPQFPRTLHLSVRFGVCQSEYFRSRCFRKYVPRHTQSCALLQLVFLHHIKLTGQLSHTSPILRTIVPPEPGFGGLISATEGTSGQS